MTAALTPDFALAYLEALNWGIRAAAVLDANGELLAGSRELVSVLGAQPEGPRQGRWVDSTGEGAPAGDGCVRIATPRGTVLLARSEHHQIAVLAGAAAMEELLAHDIRRTLTDLAPGQSVDAPGADAPGSSVDAPGSSVDGASVNSTSSDSPSEGDSR